MKYCDDYAALLDLYVDGELSPDDMDRVRAHLETCPGCRAYVDDALAIRAAFPDVEDTEVPAGFAESVMSAVQAAAQERPAAPQAKKRHWGRVLLPLAACCAIVILLHGVTGSKNSPVEFATASSSATDTATTESESIAETEEAAAEAPAETPADGAADGGAAPETRVAFTTSDAGTCASVNDQASSKALPETGVVEAPAGAAVPEAQAAEPEEFGVEAASSVSAFATFRLTTAQAPTRTASSAMSCPGRTTTPCWPRWQIMASRRSPTKNLPRPTGPWPMALPWSMWRTNGRRTLSDTNFQQNRLKRGNREKS